MADKRLYNLDEQAVYSAELLLLVDGSSLTEAKKIAMGTIAPKIDTLATASGVVVSQYLMRLNNGAGVEVKSTIRAFFDLMVEELPETTLYSAAGNAVVIIYARRFDKVVTLMYKFVRSDTVIIPMYVDSSGSSGELYYLPETMRPSQNTDSAQEGVSLQINTSGAITAVMGTAEANYFPHVYITN